jgi:hypothetical protein
MAAAQQYHEASAQVKIFEAQKKEAQATIMQYLDDASFLALPDNSGFSFKAYEKHHEPKGAWVENCRPLLPVKKVRK